MSEPPIISVSPKIILSVSVPSLARIGPPPFLFCIRMLAKRHAESGRSVRCVGVPAGQGRALQRFVGTGMDVTEQERLTQDLQRREAYLAEAQRLSHTGSFGWNVSTDEHFWSDETF